MAECCEEWKPVVGYEGIYDVSSQGNIRRVRPAFGAKLGINLKPTEISHGYHGINLCDRGKMKTFGIHRLVAAAFIGPRPAGQVINHKDGNKRNNRVENLEYCTQLENTQHAVATGLKPRQSGELNRFAKLTEAKAIAILERRKEGAKLGALAAEYGVCTDTVRNLVTGRTWSHLQPN